MPNKTLTVPNKLSEITLGQYQKFSKLLEKEPDDDFLQKKTIEIFCGVEMKEVENYNYKSILKVIEILNKMFEQKPSKLIDKFQLNGVEFGFIPKLDDMSFGEFVDLDLSLSDWDTMDGAMAVLFRRIKNKKKNKYTIKKYDSDKTDNMENMPLDVALSALFFLESLRKELMNHIHIFLEHQGQKLPQKQRQILMKVLDGGLPFMPSAMAI